MSAVNALDWDSLPNGKSRVVCPDCGRGQKDKTMSVTVTYDGGVAHCFRCEAVAFRRGPGRKGTRNMIPEIARPDTLSPYWSEVWDASKPIEGACRDYLLARNCMVPPKDGDLRSHPDLRHPSGYSGPCLVALITDAVTRRPISLQRTWVRGDGSKAITPSRLLAAGHRKAGGVIRLYPDEMVTTGLGIAEGVETALSLAHAFTPVWAVVDAGNMAKFGPLLGIEALIIAADHDVHGKGQDAAAKCADLWLKAGREVRVVLPHAAGSDLNDVGEDS